jgi:PASTA domain-containing protein
VTRRESGLTDRPESRWAYHAGSTEGFWVRRFRFTHRVGDRWEKLAYWYWLRWYRFIDRIGGSRQRRADRLVRRSLDRSPRASVPAVAFFCVALAVAVAVAVWPLPSTSEPIDDRPTAPIIDATPGIDVPDVRGMSVLEARAQLEHAGLRFERATAVVGTPGEVLGTLPSTGLSVPSATPVILIIGVEAERIGSIATVPRRDPPSDVAYPLDRT